MKTIQELIATLETFWGAQGCVVHHGHDVETGAGTFNPATFFRCLGPEPYRAAYTEPSRRPKDGRYAQNPNRMQLFHQFQVVIKPSPPDIQQQYLRSLEAIGFELSQHDIRFVHDDWEQPTLGAAGLGWEVWRDGMEVSQFTYFQQAGGFELRPVTVELTYGIERLAMVVQGVDSVWDLHWNEALTYRDIYEQGEIEWSTYNFEVADTEMWLRHFRAYEAEAVRLIEKGLPYPAYDFVMKASHAFNLLDARGVISVTERTGYIQRIRELSRRTAETYLERRESQGFPLMERFPETRIELERPLPPVPSGPGQPSDFLLEIGSEELPATFVSIGMRNLYTLMARLLEELELAHEGIDIYGTPRRLAVRVKGLAHATQERSEERRGPALEAAFDAEGKPTKAALGFYRSLGIEVPEKPEIQEVKGREYLFGTFTKPSQSTAQLLSEQLEALILGIDFPKKMRWGSSEIRYARPLRWVVALHGEEVIPFQVGAIQSGRISQAHAQLCPGPLEIGSAGSYVETLEQGKVLVDIDARKDAILQGLATLESESQSQVLELDAVLGEVLYLTEWPQLTLIDFDQDYLQIPSEVLVSEMVQHQRYFPLVDLEGRLVNRCVVTADNKPSEPIRQGNAKVLAARLADGQFLYTQDLQTPLIEFREKLSQITFREGLGSLQDKSERLAQFGVILHGHIGQGDLEAVRRAALLCKADLASELVGEFPELQGTIGKYYALAHGENLAVAQAIDEHYMPRGDQAPLPSTPAGILLSLAERIDNLLSCFALGLLPTSSSDPYGLRRQALGIIRTLIHHQIHLPLDEALRQCGASFEALTHRKFDLEPLLEFFTNRIKTVFQDYGLSKDETAASLTGPFSDIYDTYLRAQALHAFRQGDAAYPHLAEVFKRARGQLQSGAESDLQFDPAHLVEPAEKRLHEALNQQEEPFNQALSRRDYGEAYRLLAALQPPLSSLFDEVRILAEELPLKRNRLALLEHVLALFSKLLDFSQLKLKN